MRRALMIVAVLAALLACGGGLGLARSAALARFIAPGAADVRVRQEGLGRATITYQAAGEPRAWVDQLARRLERAGWAGHAYLAFNSSRQRYMVLWYSHELRIGPLALEEYALLSADPDRPNEALVRLSYRLALAGQ